MERVHCQALQHGSKKGCTVDIRCAYWHSRRNVGLANYREAICSWGCLRQHGVWRQIVSYGRPKPSLGAQSSRLAFMPIERTHVGLDPFAIRRPFPAGRLPDIGCEAWRVDFQNDGPLAPPLCRYVARGMPVTLRDSTNMQAAGCCDCADSLTGGTASAAVALHNNVLICPRKSD